MEFNSLLESLRKVTLGAKKVIKEADENNSTYTGTADEPKDIKGIVTDICHQWDTYKADVTFPDNIKTKLDGAIGQTNPGNAGDIKDTDAQLDTDQATQKREMAGDVKAVKDQDKFVPKVSETKILGKANDQAKKAEKVSNATGKADVAQTKKDLAGDKAGIKNINKAINVKNGGISKVK